MFNLLFLISLGFGANYFQKDMDNSILKHQSNSEPFNIPETLRLLGIMVDFPLESPNNPNTSGRGKFLDQNVSEYIHFYESTVSRCNGFLLDPPPHDSSYFLRQLNAAGSYYENISAGELPFESYMIINSSSPDDGYYTASHEMEYYAKGDSLLAELFTEVLDSAKVDIEEYFIGKDFTPDDVVFIIFHAGVGQEFSYSSLDPTIYDLKSAYIDSLMMGDIQPSKIMKDDKSFDILSGLLLPETQNLLYYDVVEDIFGNPNYGTEQLCEIQIGLTGIFALQLGYELGLPPMFNNDPASINYGDPGIGLFGLMDHGSNNGHGVLPAVPNPWTRIKAGWSSVNEINYMNNPEAILMIPYSENKDAIYQINISDNEYFLIENRNNHVIPGFDIEFLRYLLEGDYLCSNCNLNCNGIDVDEIITNRLIIEQCVENNPFSNHKLNYFDVLDTLINNIDNSSLILNEEMDENVFSNFVNYDMGLPGSGILIWHVVEPLEENYLSGVNNDRYSRAIELEEADGALDIGFESYLFMGNSNSFGWKWDFWYKGNPAYADANPGFEGTIFNNYSYPNTRSSNGSETFLTCEIFDDISDAMHVKIIFDDGMDVLYLSDIPVQYLGNMINDTMASIFYQKNEVIYKHSFDGIISVMDQFDYMDGKFIYTYENTIEYLDEGACIDPICLDFEEDIVPCGYVESSTDLTCISDAQSFGDIDQDGLDEIIMVEQGQIIAKNHNGTYVDGFPVSGNFSGVPLIANILIIEDGKPEIICREDQDIIILSNGGDRLQQLPSFDSDQALAMVPWDDKMALIDGSRLLLFDLNLDQSYWLNPHSRPSGYPKTTGTHQIPSTTSFNKQKAYNYPNPITEGKTTFRFFMGNHAGGVKIRIYDAAGFLIEDNLELSGSVVEVNEYNEIFWHDISVDSGLYLAEIKRDIGDSELVRLVVIK